MATAILLALPFSSIAQVTWDNGGADKLWTTAANWSDELAPSSGKTYVVSGAVATNTIRNLDVATSTFAGTSLTIQSGALLELFRTNGGTLITATTTIPGLKVDASTLRIASSNGSVTHVLSSPVEFAGSVTLDLGGTGNFTNSLSLNGKVTGSGTLNVTRNATAVRAMNFNSDASGYSGNVSLAVSTGTNILTVNFAHASGWGTGALNLTSSQSRAFINGAGTNASIDASASTVTAAAGSRISITNATNVLRVGGLNLNGAVVEGLGTLRSSAAGATFTIGGSAVSTISSKLDLDSPNLTFNVADAVAGSAADLEISGVVSGAQGFTKSGLGTLKLSAASPAASGLFAVAAGGLSLTGDTGTADVSVADGASLSGEGKVGGNLTLGATTGASLDVDAQTANSLSVGGNVTLNGISTVNLLSGGSLVGIKVLTYGGVLTGDATNLALANAASYRPGSGVFNTTVPNVITMDIIGKSLVWNAATNNQWDVQTNTNWIDTSAAPEKFFQADAVLFDDTPGADQSIAIAQDVAPNQLRFNSKFNYTLISSTGKITGGTSLVKGESGILQINTPNSFSGGTTISQGEVRISTATALGTGAITLGDAATAATPPSLYLDAARTVVAPTIIVSNQASGTIKLGSRSTVTGSGNNNAFQNITLQRDVTFDSNAADRTDYQNITGTGNITIIGAGRTILSTANTFTGDLTVSTGTTGWVQPFLAGCIPDTTNVTISAGGNLRFGVSEGINALNGAGYLWLNTGAAGTFTVTIGVSGGTGSFGGIMKNNGTQLLAITKTGAGTQSLTGIASTNTGATIITGGTLETAKLADGGVASSIGQSANAATSLIINGATLAYTGAGDNTNRLFQLGNANTTTATTITIDQKGSGALNFTNSAALGFGTNTGPRLLRLSGTSFHANTFTPALSNNTNSGGICSLEKAGVGQWIIPAGTTHSYTGTTSVSGGRLIVDGAIGNSATSVAAGAFLGGVGSIGGAVAIADNAQLNPGQPIGTLTMGSLNLIGFLDMEYNGTAPQAVDSLVVTGNLTLSGTLTLSSIGSALTAPSYVLATYGTLTGTFGAVFGLPVGYELNYTFGGNQIALVKTATAYDTWINSFTSLTTAADKLKSADPDQDGLNNLAEFALDGDPTNPSSNGKMVVAISSVGAGNALTYTFPIRTGAIADPGDPANGELALLAGSMKYSVQGSDDLQAWILDISEVTPAVSAGLPALNTGWEYRTFRTPGFVDDGDVKDFFRITILDP